jgi:hypothetical protein
MGITTITTTIIIIIIKVWAFELVPFLNKIHPA